MEMKAWTSGRINWKANAFFQADVFGTVASDIFRPLHIYPCRAEFILGDENFMCISYHFSTLISHR